MVFIVGLYNDAYVIYLYDFFIKAYVVVTYLNCLNKFIKHILLVLI